jgi:hypothetical protein
LSPASPTHHEPKVSTPLFTWITSHSVMYIV